jgi:hypothetical protein
VLNFALGAITSFAAAPAAAHPGHGTGDGFSLLHYLTEPNHVLGAVGVAMGVAIVVALMRRRARGSAAQER